MNSYPTVKIKVKEIRPVSKGNAVILCEVNPRKKSCDCELFFHAIDYYRYPSKIKKNKVYKVMFEALPTWLKIYKNEKAFIKNSRINKQMNKSQQKREYPMSFSPNFFVPSGMFGKKKPKNLESLADANFAGPIQECKLVQIESIKKGYYFILVKTFLGVIRVGCLKKDLAHVPKKGQILEVESRIFGTFNLK
jgi:hypothetical protein